MLTLVSLLCYESGYSMLRDGIGSKEYILTSNLPVHAKERASRHRPGAVIQPTLHNLL